MVDRRAARAERAAILAERRAEQDRQDRRRRLWIVGATTFTILALAGVTTAFIVSENRERAAVEASAAAPIDGVEEFSDLSANHVPAPPTPTLTPSPEPAGTALPPVGGDHDPVWQNCGIYTEPVVAANAVHSLEHGAVWITYQPGIPAEQIAAITALAEGRTYMLVSPFADLKSPVVLTAWGVQLELDDATDPRAAVFVEKYHEGPQTPEPGAACTGGVGSPA